MRNVSDMSITLLDLLREDGVKLTGKGLNRLALCPFHEDKDPSFSVEVEKGLYKCFGCGEQGDAVTYLEKKRGMTKRDAMAAVFDDPAPPVRSFKDAPAPAPKFYAELPNSAIAKHVYRSSEGKSVFVVCRFKGQPKVLPYFPAVRKGRKGWEQHLPLAEGRPLYRLPELLKANPKTQVMIVEGEKCADAAAKSFPSIVVTTWSAGTDSWKRTDWSPLDGRRILISADADAPGRKCARGIAAMLHPKCPEIRIAVPPGNDHSDIASVLEKEGVDGARKWLGKLAKPYSPPKQAPKKQITVPDSMTENEHFMILGNVRDMVAVKLHTHQVLLYPRTALVRPGVLISLADLNWLLETLKVPNLAPQACQTVGSAILRKADKMGQVDLSKVMGRGLHRTKGGQFIWHLGDRLLVDGKEAGLGDWGKGDIFLPGPSIEIVAGRATVEERFAVARGIFRYRWLQPEDAQRFAGWLITSVIGGGLEWRPHIWMTGPSESGKSWILKHVAAKLLGPFKSYIGDGTAPSLARKMHSDSLPAILDEAEPTNRNVEEILNLARLASGGDGERIRSVRSQDILSLNPRFSLLMSSTKIPQLGSADASRVGVVNLSSVGVENWPSVQQSILASLSGDIPERIRASLVAEGPEIVSETNRIASDLTSKGVGSRSAMITAALTAGWRWLSSTAETINPDKAANSEPDAAEMLREILGLRLRTSKGEDAQIIDLLKDDQEQALTLSYGIKSDSEGIYIATQHAGLKRMLLRTPWAGVNIEKLICQLDESVVRVNPRRFGGFRHRPLFVPNEICRKHGIEIRKRDLYDE